MSSYLETRRLPWRVHIERHTLVALLGDVAGLSLLDLGCGDGEHSRHASRLGASPVVGVEASEEVLSVARAAERAEPLGIEYLSLQPGEAAFHERFDLVIASFVLDDAPTARALGQMARRVAQALKSGGRFVAMVNNAAQSPLAFEASRKYGLIKSASGPLRDGAPLAFELAAPGAEPYRLDRFFLTQATQESALASAGFRRFRWHRPDVAPDGRRDFPPDYWYDFLHDPPVVFLEAFRA